MQEAVAFVAPDRKPLMAAMLARVRTSAPTLTEFALTTLSAFLLVLSFPSLELWPLAWIALVPLFVGVAGRPKPFRAFFLGWLWGTLFFYGSCWWLTYSMIRYGHLSVWLSYSLLLIPIVLIALFPAVFCVLLARATLRFGRGALLAAPFVWISLELGRLLITGQMWNAVGYSQAYVPWLIQSARWGGVYAVGFLVVSINAAIALVLLQRSRSATIIAISIAVAAGGVIGASWWLGNTQPGNELAATVVAVQPNVPMQQSEGPGQMQALLERHLALSARALDELDRETGPAETDPRSPGPAPSEAKAASGLPRLVIWPESPMSFSYSGDSGLREVLANFTRARQVSVLLNTLEPAPNDGAYNAAVMVNEEGGMVAQYDKIRLMPFGEYVPLPQWLPGAGQVRALVGEFTPGQAYSLMPVGRRRAGVFICFESAFPSIARTFTNEGADVLINISNDGYLGPTPVMRQHLANAVFRAVENNRPVLRVTNTGITAFIEPNGAVRDATGGFEPAVRTWAVNAGGGERTFYTRRGDLFAFACGMVAAAFIAACFFTKGNLSDKREFDKRG